MKSSLTGSACPVPAIWTCRGDSRNQETIDFQGTSAVTVQWRHSSLTPKLAGVSLAAGLLNEDVTLSLLLEMHCLGQRLCWVQVRPCCPGPWSTSAPLTRAEGRGPQSRSRDKHGYEDCWSPRVVGLAVPPAETLPRRVSSLRPCLGRGISGPGAPTRRITWARPRAGGSSHTCLAAGSLLGQTSGKEASPDLCLPLTEPPLQH